MGNESPSASSDPAPDGRVLGLRPTRPEGRAGSVRLRLWILLLLLGTGAALWGLQHLTRTVRLEARERFYEQYNRQQLLLARQAARTVEQLFDVVQRQLGLVVSLFESGEVTRERAAEVEVSLVRAYETLAGTELLDMALFDRNGVVVWSFPSSPGTVGANLAWRDYFLWARDRGRSGQVYLTPFRAQAAGKAKGTKAMNVVEGIYDRDGTFRGLALFTVDFNEVGRKHVLSVRIGRTGFAWLMDSNNQSVLVHPSGELNGQSFDEAFLKRWPRLHALLVGTREGRPGTGWYDFEDPVDPDRTVRKLVGYAPVRVGDRLWVLGVATPEREVEALLSSFLNRQEVLSTATGATLLLGAAVLCALLLTWNRTLSRQVALRSRDLADARAELGAAFEELLSAKKLAAVGQMALGLTHEIRNPLSAIRMNVQMIREDADADGRLRENYDIVDGEIRRLNRLLDDVMSFARPRPLRLTQVDLGEAVQRVVRLTERLLTGAGVSVAVAVPAGLEITADPEQLQQVLLNLVLNAVEAMREVSGARRLSIGAVLRGESVTLRVADTGIGVAPEDRERIFDPFFTTKSKGGGLGLPTLQSIVLRHGGGIEVESDGRSGASFTVRLPVAGPPGVERVAS